MNELPDFLRALRKYPGMAQTRLGLQFLLLTGVRTNGLRLATPEQFDLERGLWKIPPENVKQLQRMVRKAGKDVPPYLVPLSAQAIEIVRELRKMFVLSQRYILRGRDRPEERMGRTTLNDALWYIGYGNRLTAHGIRATLSTVFKAILKPGWRYSKSLAEDKVLADELRALQADDEGKFFCAAAKNA
jgi:integrase